ncbi:MAG: hypothetical protein KF810_16860 [Rhizobiaceae bacterium]|nr:hypothetical protein [Rhizobiaceae bacterium]
MTIVSIANERFRISGDGPNGLVEIQTFNGAQGWWHSAYLKPDDIRALSAALLAEADRLGELAHENA